MDADRNLLFGVLALQTELIDARQFVDVCGAWATRRDLPLGTLLVERGWISDTDRADVERLLERKLRRYGSVRASLAAAADPQLRQAMNQVDDPEIRRSIAELAPAAGHVLVETIAKPPEPRSRYTLTRLHGQGGLGKVWIAHDQDLNREVALKELQPQQASHPEIWRRFLKEAQVTGQLEHPNIVPVYELTRRPEDHQPFYTMKFVRGRTLRDAIRDYHTDCGDSSNLVSRALEFRRLLGAFVSVCQAIAYAHSRGVIHRDLKPENVVLGDFGEVIVLDWGLAKLAGSADPDAETVGISADANFDATQAGRVLGTPAYMSPEQAEGKIDQVDALSDVYGLGAMLFAILTGEPPHSGNDTADVLRQIIQGPTPRAGDWARNGKTSARTQVGSTVRRDVLLIPAALDAICLKAMSKARSERYTSSTDLANDVQRYLADEPTSAYTDPLTARMRRWLRRHQTLTVSLAASLLVALAGLGALAILQSSWNDRLASANDDLLKSNERERAARDQADRERREAEAARGDAEAARARAEQAQAAAEKTQQEAEAVTDYLTRAFGTRDPSADARPITAAEMLTQAARRVDRELNDQPEVQVRILHAIAKSFENMALPQASETHQKALSLARERLGPTHPLTFRSMNNLAMCCYNFNKYSDGLLLEDGLAAMRVELGQHPETLTALHVLSGLYHKLNQLDKAIPLMEESLERRVNYYGTDHYFANLSRVALGLGYESAQQFDKSEPFFRDAVQSMERSGQRGWYLDQTRVFLGRVLAAAGRDEEAEEHLLRGCQALWDGRHKLDPLNHVRLSGSIAQVVRFYRTRGKNIEAAAWKAKYDEWKKETAIADQDRADN